MRELKKIPYRIPATLDFDFFGGWILEGEVVEGGLIDKKKSPKSTLLADTHEGKNISRPSFQLT